MFGGQLVNGQEDHRAGFAGIQTQVARRRPQKGTVYTGGMGTEAWSDQRGDPVAQLGDQTIVIRFQETVLELTQSLDRQTVFPADQPGIGQGTLRDVLELVMASITALASSASRASA